MAQNRVKLAFYTPNGETPISRKILTLFMLFYSLSAMSVTLCLPSDETGVNQ